MKYEIDQVKLISVLKSELDSMAKTRIFYAGSVVIGELNGMQVTLKITKDKDDFQDESDNEYICITAA